MISLFLLTLQLRHSDVAVRDGRLFFISFLGTRSIEEEGVKNRPSKMEEIHHREKYFLCLPFYTMEERKKQ